MTRRTIIYISAPYSQPSPGENTRRAMETANRLLDLGYCVIVPHLSYFLDIMQTRPYEEWMDVDFSLVLAADAVLRMPGESPGADREVQAAFTAGIPVYFDFDLLLDEEPTRR